jgi:hypothetical protein
MKLQNASKSLVPSRKITDYLLSPSHPAGKTKAKFFINLGFPADGWEVLTKALKKIAMERDIRKTEMTPFGLRYTIEGPLEAPNGNLAWVRTVWFVEKGSAIPRFVTAYPILGRKK